MSSLEALLAETMVADALDEGIGEGFEFLHRSQMKACEKFTEIVSHYHYKTLYYRTLTPRITPWNSWMISVEMSSAIVTLSMRL